MPRNHDRLVSWKASVGGTSSTLLDDVRACLDDDLNTPEALAQIDKAAASGVDVTPAAALLGVDLALAVGPR
jgi:L-cysteine:1D-myo-inositol 2-amino-2-deoxy-alpha-D-glucopyranoside ligase